MAEKKVKTMFSCWEECGAKSIPEFSRNLSALFLYLCCSLVVRSCLILCNPLESNLPGILCLWDFPSKNTGVGCHFLLQGIFLTQGSNLCLLIWQMDSLLQRHHGSPYLCSENNCIHNTYTLRVYVCVSLCVCVCITWDKAYKSNL